MLKLCLNILTFDHRVTSSPFYFTNIEPYSTSFTVKMEHFLVVAKPATPHEITDSAKDGIWFYTIK